MDGREETMMTFPSKTRGKRLTGLTWMLAPLGDKMKGDDMSAIKELKTECGLARFGELGNILLKIMNSIEELDATRKEQEERIEKLEKMHYPINSRNLDDHPIKHPDQPQTMSKWPEDIVIFPCKFIKCKGVDKNKFYIDEHNDRFYFGWNDAPKIIEWLQQGYAAHVAESEGDDDKNID